MPILEPDRRVPIEAATRHPAHELVESSRKTPALCPHTFINTRQFAENEAFKNPVQLLLTPDPPVIQMLRSRDNAPASIGLSDIFCERARADNRKTWRLFAEKYHLLPDTSFRHYYDLIFAKIFSIEEPFGPETADDFYNHIDQCLKLPCFRPRALYDRFNIEQVVTAESPLDDLRWHKLIQKSGWSGKIIPTYCPDNVVDPEHLNFLENLEHFADISGEDTSTWQGYLAAHKRRRVYFKAHGAITTAHQRPNLHAQNMSPDRCKTLFKRIYTGDPSPSEVNAFRAQMLTEMAHMSLDDGLTMQLHPSSTDNDGVFAQYT